MYTSYSLGVPKQYPSVVEGRPIRDPEWEELERGYGQVPLTRTITWSNVTNAVKSVGPTVVVNRRDHPK